MSAENEMSNEAELNIVVGQVSTIGALFLIFINDLPTFPQSLYLTVLLKLWIGCKFYDYLKSGY